jgi:hypothetical protein
VGNVLASGTEIHHVHERSEPDVIGDVPTRVSRVLVKNDAVAAPKPVVAELVLVRGEAEIAGAQPETLGSAALQRENMAVAETAGKVSVLLRQIEVEERIAGARLVSNPAIVRIHVGRIRMSPFVAVVRVR